LRNFLNHIPVKIFLVLPGIGVKNGGALNLRAFRARSPGVQSILIRISGGAKNIFTGIFPNLGLYISLYFLYKY